MLYLGQRDGKVLILHNTWGVKVREPDGSEGVKKIGKCCITTLQPGRELPNRVLPDADYRRTITAMILLAPNSAGKDKKEGQ